MYHQHYGITNPYQAPTDEEFIQSISASTPDLSTLVNRIANTKVKTKSDMIQLVQNVSIAIGKETNNNKHGEFTSTSLLAVIQYPQAPEPHNALYPTLFKQLRQEAQKYNANQTDKAILDSAYWYFKNIEEPTLPKNPKVPKTPPPSINPDELKDLEKKEKKSKYIKWGVIGGSALIGMTMIYFAFFHNKNESKRKSNPKRISSGVGVVTSGRVRKRNRKAPVKVGLMKSNPSPVLPKASSLAEYRKKFDQEKKMKAIGDHKPATKKAISKKPATKSRGLRLKK